MKAEAKEEPEEKKEIAKREIEVKKKPKEELDKQKKPSVLKKEKEEYANTKPVVVTKLDANPPTAVKFANGRVVEEAGLHKGSDGFLKCCWKDDTEQSFELPNLVLDGLKLGPTPAAEPKPKKKAKKLRPKPAAAHKRPAAAAAAAPAVAAGPVVPAAVAGLPAPAAVRYGIMYYKNTHIIGLRQKYGEQRQVVSFGGKASQAFSKLQMKEIAARVVTLLTNGCSYAEAKAEGQRLAS